MGNSNDTNTYDTYLAEPIRKNSIYFHAYRTRILAGNPFAIFQEMISSGDFEEFTYYWVYTDEEEFEYDTFRRYKDRDNVVLVKANTDEYYQALATCEYFVDNAALPNFWQKRDGQKYINTWHGTPLKSLGKTAIDSSKSAVSNAQRNFILCDYLVMPNRYTADKLLESYDIRRLFNGRILDAGYPRNDLVLNTDRNRIRSLLEDKIGGSLEGKKVVLYAPTFRSEKGKSKDTSLEMVGYIEQMVEDLPENYVMFFKVHNTLGAYFKNDNRIRKSLIFDEIETNELLSATDVLITDYSSIFFDYLCTGRPILFFVYDRKEYEREHGLYLSMDDMPGKLCYTPEDVIDGIRSIEAGEYSCANYEECVRLFAYNDDGSAAKRVVDTVFKGIDHDCDYRIDMADERKHVLVSLDKTENLTDVELFLDLLNTIDFKDYKVTVSLDGGMWLSRICETINQDIQILFSGISFNKKAKEYGTQAFYDAQRKKYFGDLCFDVFINMKNEESDIDELFEADSHCEKYAVLHSDESFAETVKKLKYKYRKIYVVAPDSEAEATAKDAIAGNPEKTFELIGSKQLFAAKNGKMTVLCIAGFDSMNYTIAACIKELRKRGHRVILVTRDGNDRINNKPFFDMGLEVTGILNFDYSVLKYVDMVLAAPIRFKEYIRLYVKVEEEKLFKVSFSTLFSSIAMRIKPDILFCIGENKFDEFRNNYLHYNCVAVGNPQYDCLIDQRRDSDKGTIEKVLVIDQGGYPYGKKGKQQLADTLCRIARENSAMRFEIKPRYIPGAKAQTTHLMSEHLYDYLDEMPSNLSLIMENVMLEDIVGDYDAMITTWSTAYLDALVLDMPLILIDGLDSIDVFDVRRQRVAEAYEHLKGTGCVYNYSELGNLHEQFKSISSEYAEKEIYKHDQKSAPKAVDIMEQCYERFVLNNIRFAECFNMREEEFSDQIQNVKTVSTETEEYVETDKYAWRFNFWLQETVYINRCMGNELDLSQLERHYTMPERHVGDFKPYWQKKKAQLNEEFLEIKEDFFTREETMQRVGSDRILQDYYFDWLYASGRYEEIENFRFDLLTPETRAYYLAKINLKDHKKKAFEYLFEFADSVNSCEVVQLLKQRRAAAFIDLLRKGRNNLLFYRYLDKFGKYDVMRLYDHIDVAKNAVETYFLMKSYNRDGMYEEALNAFDEFESIYKKQLKRGKKGYRFQSKKFVRRWVLKEKRKALNGGRR